MNRKTYQVVQPEGELAQYWLIGALLAVSLLTPLVAWVIWRDGDILSRSGSLMVFFAATAEFLTLNRANKKHILNACRAKDNEIPWDFSKYDKVVGVVAFIIGLMGIVIWGFGNLLLGT